MSFSILYKRLCEVQIRHGYYLNRNNGVEDYTLPDAGVDYDIGRDLEIRPDPATLRFLERHQIRFRTTAQGFFLAVRVKEPEAGSSPLFEPFIPFPLSFALSFTLRPKHPHWLDITSCRRHPEVPAIFHFSNVQPLAGSDEVEFPFLHLRATPYLKGRAYEMGELVYEKIGGPGSTAFGIYMARKRLTDSGAPGSHTSEWKRLALSQQKKGYQFHSYRDRRLLPSRFTYTFAPEDGVTVKKGNLMLSQEGVPVAQIAFDSPEALTGYSLDFAELDLPNGFYILEVNSESGYQDRKELYVNDALYDPRSFGVLTLEQEAGLGDFALLDDAGNLRLVDGQHPVFRVHLKSRFTYRRYEIAPGQELHPSNKSEVDFYEGDTTRLITKEEVPFIGRWVGVAYEEVGGGTEYVYLPAPADLSVREDAEGRLLHEVFLPRLKTT